ncbi:MAG: peptidylprolyl isomerase [Wenzhouxiangella sp.]
MKSPVIRILSMLLVLLPVWAVAQNSEEIDRIVALVEDDVILESELDQAIDSIERQVRARGESLPPRNVLEEQMLERLIMTRLEVLRAEATGIRVSDADVDQALNQVAQQNNMSLSQLRAALEAEGMEFAEFRQEIREEMLSSRLRQRIVESMDEISETEVDIMLASDQVGGEEYLLSQIVITVPESADPAEVEQARERAEEVMAQLDDGMEFSAAAIAYSQGPGALEGGDVGWRSLRAMPQMFVEAIGDLSPGEVSEIIRTPAGFVIIKVRDIRDQSEVIVQEYRARHILIEPSELVSPEDAEQQIHDLHERIEQGEDFEALARRYSNDESSANLGGLMDWFPAGRFGEEVQRVIDELEPGEISEPFRSSMGWHILELVDEREADRTEEALRAEARERLRRQKGEEEVERFLRQLRAESFVEKRL